MGIWYRRPLFSLCTAWMLAASLCLCPGVDGRTMCLLAILCAVPGVVLGGLFLSLPRLRSRFRRPHPTLRRILHRASALLLCAALACLNTGIYFARQVTPTSFPDIEDTARDGETAAPATWEVTATVTDRLSDGGQMTALGLRLDTVNGTPVGTTLHPARAYLHCDYVSDLQPGYVVRLTAQALPLEEVVDSSATSLRADGYSLALLSGNERDVTITSERDGRITSRIRGVRQAWAARLQVMVGPDGAGLPAAMLLGERAYLSPSVRRDFSRTGVSHLLAISGFHMVLLCGLAAALLRLCLPHLPRKGRAILLATLAFGYLCLLGFPPSATRAALMLGMVYLSQVCSARADPLTSLGLAGALIVGVTPCALVDVGFWMSFSATLGLITIMPAVTAVGERKPPHRAADPSSRRKGSSPFLRSVARRLSSAVTILLSGVVAMTFSLWITVPIIGTVSPLSPLTTLLATPLCTVLLPLSLALLPLGRTWIGQGWLLPALRRVCTWMTALTGRLSAPSWATVSLRRPYIGPAVVLILLLGTGGLLLLLGLKLKHRRRCLVTAILSMWLALGTLLSVSAYVRQDQLTITYLHPATTSEFLVMTRGAEAVVCDLSDGSHTALRASFGLARAEGATETAVLMLTHYHSRMAGTLWHILSSETVRTLWLPLPTAEKDYYLLLSCLERANACGVPVFLYAPGEEATLFDSAFICLRTSSLERSVQPVLMVTVRAGGAQLTYVSASVWESDLAPAAEAAIGRSQTVIFGAHGPKVRQPFAYIPSDRTRLLCLADPSTAAHLQTDTLPDAPPTMVVGPVRVTVDCP